jgi:hypothetical protein
MEVSHEYNASTFEHLHHQVFAQEVMEIDGQSALGYDSK